MGKIFLSLLNILVYPALLLFLSGDWLWTEGWIFSVWFVTLSFTTILYLYRKDPALLAERYKKPGFANHKSWDRYVVYGLLFGFIAWIVLMPLDAKRFGWSAGFPFALKVIGAIVLLFSFFFFYRSFTDNTFLSPLIRIQQERKQKLITTGVYAVVRHPMYLGAILMFVGAPLMIGSGFGIIVGVMLTILIGSRTLGEEQMMLEELEGYVAYKQKVKYRFIPFIW